MKKLKSLTALALASVLVVGCGSSNDKEDTSSTDNSGDKKIVTVAMKAGPNSFDPTTQNNAPTIEMINAQLEGLYRLEVDADDKVTGTEGMAEKVDVSEDGKEYTFTLRDTKWSNGDPVTANDFVFSFRRLFTEEDGINNRFFAMKGLLGLLNAEEVEAGEKDVEELGVEAIDDKTLKLTLQDPCPIIKSLLAYPAFFPLNEKFVTEQGTQFGTSVESTLSCGPYVLTRWEPENSVAFEKNKDYYAADDIKVDGLEFMISSEANTRAMAYDSNQVLMAHEMTSELVANYEGTEGFTEKLQSYVGYLSYNSDVPGLENINLRKAMSLAIDKEVLTKDILKDGSEPTNFIIPKGLANGPDGVDFRESVGEDVQYLAPDKDKAKEYFETAKTELGTDTFSFKLMVGESDINKSIAEFIKSQIEETLPGVTIVIDIQPSAAFYDKANAKEHEILSIMWGPDYPYPTTYTDLWAKDGANNYSKYTSEEYDRLQVATSRGEYLNDPEKRWDAFKEMEKILIDDDAAITPLFQRGWIGLVNPKLTGVGFRSSGVKWDYRNVEIAD